jgi:hypothetical protein
MSLRESIPSSSRRIFMRGIVCNPTTHPSEANNDVVGLVVHYHPR